MSQEADVETKVFHYNELPEHGKQRARQNYIDHWVHDEWYDYIYEDAREAGSVRGFEIDKMYFSGFYSQGDGASWVGDVKLKPFMEAYLKPSIGVDAWLWLIEDGWVHDRVPIYQRGNYYCHDMTMCVGNVESYEHDDMVLNVDCILKGAPIATLWNLIMANNTCPIKSPEDLEEFVIEKARYFARQLYKRLREGYEREIADDQIGDCYDANNVLFNEEGEAV